MKKFIISLFILFLTVGLSAEDTKYTEENFLNYLTNYPGSSLPEVGERIEIQEGFFTIESIAMDGPGQDYIVKYSGASLSPLVFSRKIYIYSETMKTRKMWQGQSLLINAESIIITYTGKTAPAINAEGNRVELPIFIAEGL